MSDRLTISGYPCCTVQELIDHLKTMPPDAPVMYQCYSDYAALELGEIKYIPAADEKLVRRHDGVHDKYLFDALYGNETPVYVSAVTFPGN